MVLNLIKAAKKPLSIAFAILALLWFWPDIRDLPDAYGLKWGQIMPDRTGVAYIMLGLSLLWIIWMDIRPIVHRWIESLKTTSTFCEDRRTIHN